MLLLFALAVSLSAHADDCLNRDQLSSYRDLIHRAAVVDGEGRRTEEKYAAEKGLPLRSVQNRFAATGVINCNGTKATAQLTGANDVITTAAHVFYPDLKCNLANRPESCTFTLKNGTAEKVLRIKSSVAIGYKCPQGANQLDDWAVLKLDGAAEGVNPYELPSSNDQVRGDDKVVSVLAGSMDFTVVDRKSGRKSSPKTIDECTVKRTIVFDVMAKFESDCDAGPGGSGGAVLKRQGGRDLMVGITVHSNANLDQEREAAKQGRKLTGSYAPNNWSTYHLPLDGAFLKAVERATDGQST